MKKFTLCSFVLCVLIGCGGSGSPKEDVVVVEEPLVEAPEVEKEIILSGVYSGEIHGTDYANGHGLSPGLLIIDNKGNFYSHSVYNYMHGNIKLSEIDLSGSIDSYEICNRYKYSYPDNIRSCAEYREIKNRMATDNYLYANKKYTGELIGSINEDYLKINIEFEDSSLSSSMDMTRHLQSDDKPKLETIVGTHATRSNDESLSIDIDGYISGSSSDGCVYDGYIKIEDKNVNIYYISLDVSNCINDGKVEGVATYLKSSPANPNRFHVYLKGDDFLIKKIFVIN